jgi:hypothetical protein
MEHIEHTPAHTVAPVAPLSRKETLRWLEVSFTDTGFAAVRAYRTQLSLKTGRPVSLAQSLDALIKTHPFVTGAGVSP